MVEYGECREIFKNPLHPYTRALFSAIPIPDPTVRRDRIILEGSLPSPAQEFKGCRFQSRCKQATERCLAERPAEKDVGGGHRIVCHLYD
jgi:peptide/nickel transport system ATP-binding protein